MKADLLQIVNRSLTSGIFPEMLKRAAVKPLLKNRNQDASILNNYRPVSNLPFLAKIIEKVVLNQLSDFLGRVGILDKFQSGFRPHHSTETTLVKVLNDKRLNTDSVCVSMLVLLDLSAAFDTVDYGILMHRLESWVGLLETVLKWFRSYLEHRRYLVKIGTYESEELAMTSGVPQGSILGLLLFNVYMLPLSQIIKQFNIDYHSYADDTPLYVSLVPGDLSPVESLCKCLEQITNWMSNDFLHLNQDKTEIILFGNKEKRTTIAEYLETRALKTTNQVCNLGVVIDSDLTFNSHIKSVTKTAFYRLKNINGIKTFIDKKDQEMLIHAFISSRLDYYNGLLTGPKKSMKQLQLYKNAAARVLTGTKRRKHITPVLKTLHWLPVSHRIDYKALQRLLG